MVFQILQQNDDKSSCHLSQSVIVWTEKIFKPEIITMEEKDPKIYV